MPLTYLANWYVCTESIVGTGLDAMLCLRHTVVDGTGLGHHLQVISLYVIIVGICFLIRINKAVAFPF